MDFKLFRRNSNVREVWNCTYSAVFNALGQPGPLSSWIETRCLEEGWTDRHSVVRYASENITDEILISLPRRRRRNFIEGRVDSLVPADAENWSEILEEVIGEPGGAPLPEAASQQFRLKLWDLLTRRHPDCGEASHGDS